MRTAGLRRAVDRAAAELTADSADTDARARRAFVAEVERILRGSVANLEAAMAERGIDPAARMSRHWPEPAVGPLTEFLRGELAAVGRFDRDDVGTAVVFDLWLRSYTRLVEDLGRPPPDPAWPCPTAWLELQLFRLTWQRKEPGAPDNTAESNRLYGQLWGRPDFVDPVR